MARVQWAAGMKGCLVYLSRLLRADADSEILSAVGSAHANNIVDLFLVILKSTKRY